MPDNNEAAGTRAAAAAAASIGIDLSSVRIARAAALAVVERITEELPRILNPMDRIEMRLDRNRARNLAGDLEQIEIDLVASVIVVTDLTAVDVAELGTLAAGLDEQIVRSKLVNLGLETVGQVLESAIRVRDIVRA